MLFEKDESGRIIIPSSWIIEQPRQETSRYRGYSPVRTYRPSLWSWFDDAIIGIGNGIARNLDTVSNVILYLAGFAFWGLVIAYTVIGFSQSVGYGIFGIFLGMLLGGIAFFIISILKEIFVLLLAIIRFIFWRGGTFLLFLTIGAAIVIIIAMQ